jgi:AraC-like DNA-binding protein
MTASASTRGILEPAAAATKFRLSRFAPAPDLAPFVERHWIVSWDLRGHPPFTQEVLPHPCVNLVVEPGLAAVHGVGSGRFARELRGHGRAVGVKFRPGGFRPFAGFDVAELTGDARPVEALFGAVGDSLRAAVDATPDDRAATRVMEAFLRDRMPPPDPNVELIGRLAREMLGDPGLTRVDELAARAGLSPRSLQRLFRRYVGVSPKWMLQRYRLHEAAERVAEGRVDDWTDLALELGYADQAHFINDFRALVGRTPGEYAAAVRDAAAAVLAA